MSFSSPIFLFLFLPFVLTVYFLIRRELRNSFLLCMSLLFYAWGEKGYVLIMLFSMGISFVFGLVLERFSLDEPGKRKAALALAVLLNISLLFYFKYVNFLVSSLSFGAIRVDPIHLPNGISFFTFHALSYVIDVYRRDVPAQRNPFDIALYISIFPKLIAGPIIRYHDIAGQIFQRKETLVKMTSGIQRFIVGLGKKVLIANTLGAIADQMFSLPTDRLTMGLSWLGIICYTLQIYYDFSGYSDMAIGLGRMFGFEFMENFQYPYISQSIREFWRRWHISLSTWFRDYLYIPLGGNRGTPLRTHVNLLIVFFLCGLWHGANWTFVFWGLWHGCFLVLERLRFGRWLTSLWTPLRHLYALCVIMTGWVFFRSQDLSYAFSYLQALAGLAKGDGMEIFVGMYLNREVLIALGLGILFSAPVYPSVGRWRSAVLNWSEGVVSGCTGKTLSLIHAGSLFGIFILCAMKLASGTYNPFIYFRF
jgi:alginate O-acetyltransferase complex protein AlgI